jgi:hypothetical protein
MSHLLFAIDVVKIAQLTKTDSENYLILQKQLVVPLYVNKISSSYRLSRDGTKNPVGF